MTSLDSLYLGKYLRWCVIRTIARLCGFTYNISDHNLKLPLNSISLHAGYNDLTGSIPSELLYKNYSDFDVYGNDLSNLTAVDGEVVCSAEEGGEHYCDCGYDCGTANQCACEEAEACCATFMEQYTECILCESGIENPDFIVEVYSKTCFDISADVGMNLVEFGTDIQCDEAKIAMAEEGCICKGDALDSVEPAEGTI